MNITLIEKFIISIIVLVMLSFTSVIYIGLKAISRNDQSRAESSKFINDNHCKITEKTDGFISKEKYICDNGVKYER